MRRPKEPINIKSAIDRANNLDSKIDGTVMAELEGLSSKRVRHLLNNLAAQASTYLEIGCYLGGTLRAALHSNQHLTAYAIDDFSMMPNKRKMFFDNMEGYTFEFFEENAFTFDVKSIKTPIEVYFYDGHHSFESQYLAIKHLLPAMANEFIYVCDDWDMKKIPNATFTACKDLKLTVDENYDLPGGVDKKWWGGLGILRVRK